MTSNTPIASVEATSNGILVHYREAVRRRRRLQSSMAGLDMSYFKTIFEVMSQQMGGGEDWEDEKKQARLNKIQEALKSAKTPDEDKYVEEWVAESRAIFCQKMEEVPAAIQKAYDAYVGIMSIIRDGDTVRSAEIAMEHF
jgi:hypothetical protein